MGYGPLTTEQKKERHRKYAHDHFLRTKCVFRDKPKQKLPTKYGCWVQPLNGDFILIGPFKNKKAAMAKRMKTVRELIAEGNAREFDIKCLELYEQGFFEDDPNDK